MIDCPVDGRKNITTQICPQCKTDLSPLIYIRELPEELFTEGTSFIENGLYDDAIRKFITALEEEPQNFKYLLALGKAYFLKGMPDEALLYASQALIVNPGNEESLRLQKEWSAFKNSLLLEEKKKLSRNRVIRQLLLVVPVLTLATGIFIAPIFRSGEKIPDPKIIASQAAGLLANDQNLQKYPISVNYSDLTYTLSGNVPTYTHRALAEEILKNVLLKNELTQNEIIGNSISVKPDQLFISYTIRSGDNLGKISGFFFGNTDLWSVIMENNSDVIQDPYHLQVGVHLKIPVNELNKPESR
jgi:tetratricopeptide (TPR) repeat protein